MFSEKETGNGITVGVNRIDSVKMVNIGYCFYQILYFTLFCVWIKMNSLRHYLHEPKNISFLSYNKMIN